jgi:hypothetical protein
MRSSALTVVRCVAAAIGLAAAAIAAPAKEGQVLRPAAGGTVRALIIGIDAYAHVRPLKGAVADARDIEGALRAMGTTDLTALINAEANRASILHEIERLVTRTQPEDLVVLSIAGHGTQEPERVKGSEPDGMDNVFLLPGFQPTAAGSQERILGQEFNHFIKQLEQRGARIVFVADTCHGGGMAREIDPRIGTEEMSFRQVPSYRLPDDLLKPVSTASDAFLTELDFERTEFLAAVDRKTKSPEVKVPGIAGLRGALSYAVARAFEGSADANGDGRVTVKELFSNVRQVVYQLSDQRQNIITVSSHSRNLDTDVVFQLTRGVSVIEPVALTKPPGSSPPSTTSHVQQPPSTMQLASELPPRIERPVRLAALDNQGSHFAGLEPRQAAFEIVNRADSPDLLWDPASHDLLAWGGDVIAYGLEKSELPSAIDRAAAIRQLKQIATKAIQPIRTRPDDGLHHEKSRVHIEVADVKGRALIVFNIVGDGTVQMLYPVGSDLPIIASPEYRFPVEVGEPFGADQIVAITSEQRMTELEKALLQLDRRRAAAQAIRMVEQMRRSDARIGSTGLFTAR